jgi:hypothetical protein
VISGRHERRGRALFWSTIASVAIHLIIVTLVFYEVARLIVPRGRPEQVSRTEIVTIKKVELPTPAPPRPAHRVKQQSSAPATTPRHELVKETVSPAPHVPRQESPPVPSKIARDEAGFAREVARLNAQNDPHAIPTIDPASRQSNTKSYAFDIPSSMHGSEHGNGIITPTQSWRQEGRDCYYGRYEYTYPDGATESGNILWPFCFDPGADPFKEPPHPIPFPLPSIGFKLPPDADMPPIERQVYHDWAAATRTQSPP